jgi:colanic acid biosynthesis protein WcaH
MTLSKLDSERISEAVAVINECLQNSREGLPDEIFYLVSRLTPLINVDLLIVNKKNEKLLTWREDKFYGPGWHMPGGIIRFKETAEIRIKKVANLELKTEVSFEPKPLAIREIMNLQRDIRGHFISLVYKCKLKGSLCQTDEAKINKNTLNGQWRWFAEMPPNTIKPQLQFENLINTTVY